MRQPTLQLQGWHWAQMAMAMPGSDSANNDLLTVLTDSTDTSTIYLTFEGIAQADLVEATHFEFV